MKLGWSGQPFQRIANGFWDNVHPPTLCGKLGPEHLHIVGVWRASKMEEQALHARLIPDCGEWYPEDRQEEIRAALEPFPSQPLQPLPPQNQHDKSNNKRACCTGFTHDCAHCGQTFATGRHWKRHRDQPPQRCQRARTLI